MMKLTQSIKMADEFVQFTSKNGFILLKLHNYYLSVFPSPRMRNIHQWQYFSIEDNEL